MDICICVYVYIYAHTHTLHSESARHCCLKNFTSLQKQFLVFNELVNKKLPFQNKNRIPDHIDVYSDYIYLSNTHTCSVVRRQLNFRDKYAFFFFFNSKNIIELMQSPKDNLVVAMVFFLSLHFRCCYF